MSKPYPVTLDDRVQGRATSSTTRDPQQSDPASPADRRRNLLRAPAVTRWLPVAGPGLLMLIVGLIGSTVPVLSWDEIATADVARRSAGQIWHLLHHVDAVFGAYYLSMHGWTALFGDSVLSLRLPSIVAMAAAAAVTGEFGRRLFGPVAGTVAGTFCCLLPNLSRYAAEARPYAMVCLLSVVALLLLHRALQRPGLSRWAAYAAAILGLGLCNLVALSALAGHAGMIAIRLWDSRGRWRAVLISWSLAVLGSLLALSPLLWSGLGQRSRQLHWVQPMTRGAVYTFPTHLVGSTEGSWLLLGILLLAVANLRPPVLEMVSAAALPLLVVCAVSFVGPSFWVNRYLLFTLLPTVIVAAAGVTLLRPGRWNSQAFLLPAAAFTMLLAAVIPGQVAVRRPTIKNGSDYRNLAAAIIKRQRPGDDMVFSKGRTMRAGVGYYLRHDAGRPRDVLLWESAAAAGSLTAIEYAEPANRLDSATRIWLVAYGHRADPATARPDLRTVLLHYRRIGLWEVKNGSMALYDRLS